MTGGYEKRATPSRAETVNVPNRATTIVVPYAMDWLKGRLRELGKTGADFGRALGVPKSRVYEMQRGERRLQPDEIGNAARFLQLSEAELIARLEGRTDHRTKTAGNGASRNEIDISSIRPIRQGDISLPPLLIYRTAMGELGRQGGFMLRAERVGEVARPEFLRFSEKAFAARVLDDRNAPAYRRRDAVLVDPDTPPIEGEDCLFTADPYGPGGAFSIIGCLVSSTTTCWRIRQYAVKGTKELPRSEFPNAWPIVGRYNRR